MENPPSLQAGTQTASDSLHAKILAVTLGLFVVLRLLVYLTWPQTETLASDLTAGNILSAINREREMRNLLTLNTDNRLSVAAQLKADDMIARHYFSHTDPEENYIWPKIEAAGYAPYLQLGENLAIEFYNTESLVAAWMNSPTHRANILNEGFKDQGMGLGYGNTTLGQYHSAIVNTFGSLLAKPKTILAAKNSAPQPIVQPVSPAPAKPQTTKPAITTPSVPPAETAPKTQTQPVATSSIPKPNPPLALRGEGEEPSFTTAVNKSTSTEAFPSSTTETAVGLNFKNLPKTQITANQLNRYLTLGLGVILLFLLLSDLKVSLDKKFQKVDKKVNNLILLVLALAVVALMYWL